MVPGHPRRELGGIPKGYRLRHSGRDSGDMVIRLVLVEVARPTQSTYVGEGGLSTRSLVRCPADESDMGNLLGLILSGETRERNATSGRGQFECHTPCVC